MDPNDSFLWRKYSVQGMKGQNKKEWHDLPNTLLRNIKQRQLLLLFPNSDWERNWPRVHIRQEYIIIKLGL